MLDETIKNSIIQIDKVIELTKSMDVARVSVSTVPHLAKLKELSTITYDNGYV